MNLARSFTALDQAAFADLSGDRNPVHMSAAEARRTQAGAPVVHGLHALLWALDALQAHGTSLEAVAALRVQFSKFIYLDRRVEVVEEPQGRHGRRFSIKDGALTLVSISLRFDERAPAVSGATGAEVAPGSVPADLALADMDGLEGWLPAHRPASAYARAFPHLARAWDERRVQALATLSCLVGMVCPGRHSLLARLELQLLQAIGTQAGVGFASVADERFRTIDLRVQGGGTAGKVSAYARVPPVEPPSMAQIVERVQAREFEQMTALVVGGSRGLGAAAAKIIAAGGGRVCLTYAHAEAEARAVAADIQACRGSSACEFFQLDVLDPAARDLSRLRGRFTHLFYFATPQIFEQGAAAFDQGRFHRFVEAYVIAFQAISGSLLGESGLAVFYPSSAALAQRPRGMTEYSMAKAAGEILCADMAAHDRRLRISVARLPRILTDQTATVTPVESADAVRTMLPIVRSLGGAGSTLQV